MAQATPERREGSLVCEVEGCAQAHRGLGLEGGRGGRVTAEDLHTCRALGLLRENRAGPKARGRAGRVEDGDIQTESG